MIRPPVVDAHQHFWDPGVADYPWMVGAYEPLRRVYGPADLEPELAAAGVDATIVVQARHELDETRRLLEIADSTTWVVGVVGWVDLAAPDVGGALAALRARPGGHRLVGIRHQVHDEADPDWLLRPEVLRGLAAVAEAGLVYDLLVRSRELPAATGVARRLPELTLIVDHLAKPPIASGEIEPWASLLGELRPLENVTAKVFRARHGGDLDRLATLRSRAVPADRARRVRSRPAHVRVGLAGVFARGPVRGRLRDHRRHPGRSRDRSDGSDPRRLCDPNLWSSCVTSRVTRCA